MTSPALAAYLAVSHLASAAVPFLLNRRLARGKEDPARLTERLGRAGAPRPKGRVVWIHGASVGELLSIRPLIEALGRAAPDVSVLVTSGTVTSARRIAAELPARAVHQFVPVDTAGAVRAFLDHWRPDLAIWVESEFWPRLMVETDRRGTPMMLVNARISARSAGRWRRLPGMARALLGLFARIVTQDGETATRLEALGADPRRITEGGNLKVLAGPPAADAQVLAILRDAIGARPVWLAASTHAPEEAVALDAHLAMAAEFPGLLTILAPRHPDRAEEVAALAAARGLVVTRRGTGALPGAATAIYLADTLGEMGLWFRLAPVSFVGGSIAPRGGHNPFEPAALGSAILTGPSVENFRPAYDALLRAGGAVSVGDAASLAEVAARLLGDAAARADMTGTAARVLAAAKPDVDALAAEAVALMRERPGA